MFYFSFVSLYTYSTVYSIGKNISINILNYGVSLLNSIFVNVFNVLKFYAQDEFPF